MDPDTMMGGDQRRFPQTNHSAILAARSKDPQERSRAFETILTSYWKPAYKYIRLKWSTGNEDAKDLTQGFFVDALEKGYFATYEASKASFRTFLRTCLDRFVLNSRKSESRLKRGGGVDHMSLDFGDAETELLAHAAPAELSPEQYFQREWVRNLFSLTVGALRDHYVSSGRDIQFRLFEIYDLEDESSALKNSYASLAREFNLSTSTVTNYLAAARRDFKKLLLERLREITATEDEFRIEARELLGIDFK